MSRNQASHIVHEGHNLMANTRINYKSKKMTQTSQQSYQHYHRHQPIQRHSTNASCASHGSSIFPLLICLSVILPLVPFSQAHTTTIPLASPLLGNVINSGLLLNSTIASSSRQKVPLETNSIQRNILATNPSAGAGDHSRALKRVFLSNRTVVCNDNSQAGFYLRKNPNSKKWIVFLEGGWHCFDTKSCKARWLKLRHLMTSAQWPETRDVGGILSPLHEENPYWHKANHVLVPYCSSDSWSGTRATPESSENSWRFMGSLILRQVIADLIPLGLGRIEGTELLLVGSSAGGLGVMLNLDRITSYLQIERNLKVTVRGISDSGWFIDRKPFTPAAIASSEAVHQGWKLWSGQLPERCVEQHSQEPWRCYFGYRLYPTLKSPLFVFQWLFDEAQMRADNVGAPVTPQQWNYIHEMGGALRSSLDNVTAVFAPSCIGHAVLSKRDWVNIKIDDISLPSALRCWEHSTRLRRKRHSHNKLKRSTEPPVDERRKRKNNQRHQRHRARADTENDMVQPKKRLTKEEREERRRRRNENQQRRHERRRHNRKANERNLNVAGSVEHEGVRERKNHRGQRKNRHNNNNRNNSNANASKHGSGNKHKRRKAQQQLKATQTGHDRELQYQKEQPTEQQKKVANSSGAKRRRERVPNLPQRCALRLLERCSWPQCNQSCPSLTNPLTGEEMRFLELLTSFGLDIEAVAAALGVDMHTLNNMDRAELVNLLTQQVS